MENARKNAENISLKNRLHAGIGIIVEKLLYWSKEFKVHSLGNGYY